MQTSSRKIPSHDLFLIESDNLSFDIFIFIIMLNSIKDTRSWKEGKVILEDWLGLAVGSGKEYIKLWSIGQSLQILRSSQGWERLVRKNLWPKQSWMKFTYIEEVEGKIILGFSAFNFYVAKGIGSHDILLNLLYVQHSTSSVVGGAGREK